MITGRNRVFVWVPLLLAISWISVAVIDIDSSSEVFQVLAIGYFLGSMFAHTTLAAAWAAYGPGRLLWRVPLSLLWVVLLGAAIHMNALLYGTPADASVTIGICFLLQWLLLQVPLWGLRAGLRSRLKHVDDQLPFDASPWQFGIGQLMIVTAIVGFVFGAGRLAIGTLLNHIKIGGGEQPIFVFLAVSAIVFTLPLLIAVLLKRRTIVGVLIVLFLIGAGTASEVPLLRIFASGSRPNFLDLLAVNGASSAVIMLFALAVRLNGYSLVRLPPPGA
ncbi:hypothetical protein ETAA8_36150 [Anatilimnocola aggregata]|uniref:Uncharacterized protein n=1 Tax=Anatilimnocola aggregata TaxID=2528021 RepID=A0A517YE50_9BACT|nr:hypothetical protein ETAA8_36150 [Anatilimnocola aggregata]